MSDENAIVVTGRKLPRAAKTGPVAFPDWRVTLDGEDMSAKLRPYLIRLRITEKRGGEADQLDIDLDDSKGELAIPKAGAILEVSLGWKGGGRTTPRLTKKGAFIVDEVEHAGPPAIITVRARSADFTGDMKKLRDQTWRDKSYAEILQDIAGRHSLTLRVSDKLGSIRPKLTAQTRESDVAFIARLGKENDAVATVKAGALIFLPMAGGKTASGDSLSTVTINRGEGDGHSYRIAARPDYTGVTARWHDKKTAKKVTVRASKVKSKAATVPKVRGKKVTPSTTAGSGDNPKMLKKVFASEAEAQKAADAEWSRIQRAPRSLSTRLALGRPEIGVEQPAKVAGFHPEIDDQDWIVSEATHTLDNKGLTTALNFDLFETEADAASDEGDSQPVT